MTSDEVWTLLRQVTDIVAYDEDPDIQLSDDARDLDELLARLSEIGQAVRWLRSKALEGIGRDLGNGWVRFGERVYRNLPDVKRKVKREVEGEFWEFVGPHVRQLYNPNYPRWGQLRIVAEGYVDPETGEVGWGAFESKFFDVEHDDRKIVELPLSRAPKFIADESEGVHVR